ncbi:hypothetical protein [Amycolatopsis sp. CA-230715]|uniref:hypothetical protein n=1 Tax=Amycolatopsis sp. CA-230715 TaxID=2745196 RepID=UPI001C01B724|nr:hypothetical protein [Amycolatopsis sp. CA-230715]QWF81300.1 hypothetical protein HUW46_04730 [Amycolatopsis sp. CA-230715]
MRAGVVGVVAVSALAAGVSPASAEVRQSVVGVGGMAFHSDRLTFAFDAHAVAGAQWRSRGTFHVWHAGPDGRVRAEYAGTVKCMLATAGYATVTGTLHIVRGDPKMEGTWAGFSIVGNSAPNRIGYGGQAWGDPKPGNDCTALPPYSPVEFGHYRVNSGGM